MSFKLHEAPQDSEETPEASVVTADIDLDVLGALAQRPMTTRQILSIIKSIHPGIRKTNINSRLYTLLTKKKVKKTIDKIPTWSLA
jgi:hypothetical protein